MSLSGHENKDHSSHIRTSLNTERSNAGNLLEKSWRGRISKSGTQGLPRDLEEFGAGRRTCQMAVLAQESNGNKTVILAVFSQTAARCDSSKITL